MEQIVSSALLGSAMPLTLTWSDLALRLLCTLIAGSLIGYNRGEHGKGCRDAAAILYVMNDLMRLPLGILTGVGFIGGRRAADDALGVHGGLDRDAADELSANGGAILRRGSLVVGVTTAATLWYVTVVGLCFGGGQVLLGWAATALGCLILWVMKWLESCMAVPQHFRLVVTVEAGGPGEHEIRRRLAAAAFEMRDVSLAVAGGRSTYALVVSRFRTPAELTIPGVIEELGHAPGVSALKWTYFD